MRKHMFKLTSLIAVALAVSLFGPPPAAADDDDPSTRVARMSVADGSVSFQPAGTDDWVSAVVNRPMTTGDKLWADHDSRAELQFGTGSIRLGANTGFSFLNLDDNTAQLQLTEGTVRIRLRRLNRGEIFEIDTPNLAFTASRPGIYRVNVNEAGDTTVVVVRDGEGEVTGGGQDYAVRSGETGIFTGTDQLNADIEGVGGDDDLERWSYERDRREDHSASRQYVSDEAVGYQDLDDYGGWRNTPDYGSVWFPRTTVVGWAPYRYGHWVWIAPWGYTWVDDEPWGFAPFHYGRWVAVGGAWGWVPCRPAEVGVAYVRPVYAPALVAWVGGPNVAIGVAVGGGAAVGWFPLGPREVYMPSYRVSRRYANNVNITNTTVNTTVVNNYYNTVVVNKTTVNNVTYVNQRVPGAVTATSSQVISTSQPVSRNVVRVDERQISRAQVNMGAPAVAPERRAFVGEGRPTQARPPERVVNRAVVAKTAPPPAPTPVDRQQALIRQNGGQPPAASQIRTAQPQQTRPVSTVRMAPPARPATPQQRNAGNPPPQNSNRPSQQQGNVQPNERPANNAQPNRPANNERPNAERPNNQPPNAPNAQPNRAPGNERPNNERNDRPPAARPANPNAERPNTPPNAQPNRPANNERPNAERPNNQPPNAPNAQPNRAPGNERPNNERNDRPPSARPANPNSERPNAPPAQPNRPPNNDRPNAERPNAAPPAPNAQPNPPANNRPPDRQQRQEQPQQQRPPQSERQQPPPRQQQQERQQPPPRPQQQERPQPPPPRPQQAERPQPPPRQQERQQPPPRQQQERPKQQEKPKEKDKDKDKPPKG